MSENTAKKTSNSSQRYDNLKYEILGLKLIMHEQEQRYNARIDKLEQLVKDQFEIIKENLKIHARKNPRTEKFVKPMTF